MTPSPAPTGSYKWIALSNTTIGMLIVTVNSSIVLISLPAIFRGIGLDPLTPANISYLLWMLMSFMVVTAVLVVGLGRIGDMFGRVRLYNLGFAVFTIASILLSLVLWQGPSAAITLIGLRVLQGIGGAMLMANSTAILTDAFPAEERGMALGINSVAAIAGSFVGLVLGGLLAAVDWHLVFLVSVPIGVFGTIWAFLKLREVGTVRRARMDWWGNITFGVGLILLLVGITYGIQPYGGSNMGWGNPTVLAELGGALVLLIAFGVIETRVKEPMFRLSLFKSPAFAAGNLASLLASIGRGGLMFMLIIWLQGIWLPLHGYNYEDTPLWSAIFMLPMTVGFLIAGPLSGVLSDRFGARPFAVGGMLGAAACFGLMMLLPANFPYFPFAALLFFNGLAMGLFSAPNASAVMNTVPADARGVASGMRATFMNAGMNLSIGIFFSLMIAGLSNSLPGSLFRGLTNAGVPSAAATQISHLPPVSTLFAAFLGYNPMQKLLGTVLGQIPASQGAYLTGHAFFPGLISDPFMAGMRLTFLFALFMMLVAAGASLLMGKRVAPAVAPAQPEPAARRAKLAPTVAISSTYGAGGEEIAQRVARVLRVPFIDRAIPSEAVRRLHFPADGELADDGLRGLFQELRPMAPEFGVQPEEDGAQDDDDAFRRRSEQVAREIARTSGGVILGHAATVILRDSPGVLRVRLDGPLERRLERAGARERVDADAARGEQRVSDYAREQYMRRFYDVDPNDPGLYHLTIDSTSLPPRAVAALIATAAWTLTSSAAPPVELANGAAPQPALDLGAAS